MAVQSKLNFKKFKMTDPSIPLPPPPSPSPSHDCGWCGLRAAFATSSLCPNCENNEEALAAFSAFLSWNHDVEEGAHIFESDEKETVAEVEAEAEDLDVFNCMLCGAMTSTLTMHSRVVNGEWVTEHLPFCGAMHHAIYRLTFKKSFVSRSVKPGKVRRTCDQSDVGGPGVPLLVGLITVKLKRTSSCSNQ
jgi:hypothetical protein